MKAVVLGSGGHAKVIIEILRERDDLDLVGCVAPEAGGGSVCGVKVIGNDSILPQLLEMGVHNAFVALGDNGLRFRMMNQLVAMGFSLLNAVSRHAVLSPSVTIGTGVAIMAGAVVNAESSLGDGVIVNTGATVDHDCVLETACHIAPGTNLAGCVHVGTGAFLGIGSSVIPRVRIGQWTIVGAGAAVVSDLPAEVLAVGVPARIVKKVSTC